MNDTSQRWVVLGVGTGTLLAVLGSVALQQRTLATPSTRPSDVKPSGPATLRQNNHDPVRLEVGDAALTPSLWVDVHQPSKLRRVLTTNAWLQSALKDPLGRGFAGAWAGFLGTRGQDVKATFTGSVLELGLNQLLSDPFQVVWWSGKGAETAPALVVPAAGIKAKAAFAALDAVAQRGTVTADHCPGEAVPAGTPPLTVSRWLLADQSVYAILQDDRIALARTPATAVSGLCSRTPTSPPAPEADAELALATAALGREMQALALALGLGGTVRLGFSLQGDQVVPNGIRGELDGSGRLALAKPSGELWQLVPEDVPVALTLHVKLPETLTPVSLNAFWTARGSVPVEDREVALLWNPRGDAELPSEVAVAWPAGAATGLASVFQGQNAMKSRKVCRHVVLASTSDLLDRIDAACQGRTPSWAHLSGPVVQGLSARASVGLGVHLGHLFSRLLLDGYGSEHRPTSLLGGPPIPSKEIQAASRSLEELPFFGFSGAANGKALEPGGFRS